MSLSVDQARAAPDDRDMTEITGLLQEAVRIAARIKEGIYKPDRIDSVAWRAADALFVMRRYVERRWPGEKSPGIHERTGMGARLEAYERATCKKSTNARDA